MLCVLALALRPGQPERPINQPSTICGEQEDEGEGKLPAKLLGGFGEKSVPIGVTVDVSSSCYPVSRVATTQAMCPRCFAAFGEFES